MTVTRTHLFNGNERSEFDAPIEKCFKTTLKQTTDYFIMTVTTDMRKYMKQIQQKYCKQQSPIKDVIFSKFLMFLNKDNSPANKTIGEVKKDEQFYPKFEIKTVHVD
jgi:hypothetical protein